MNEVHRGIADINKNVLALHSVKGNAHNTASQTGTVIKSSDVLYTETSILNIVFPYTVWLD